MEEETMNSLIKPVKETALKISQSLGYCGL